MAQAKVTVSLLGFDQRSARAINLTVGENCDHRIEINENIDRDNTQVVLIDMDCPNAATIWDEFRPQWPGMPVVVLSVNEVDIENTFFVQKPFKIDELMDAITAVMIEAEQTRSPEQKPDYTKFADHLSSRSIPDTKRSARALNALDPQQIYFNPESHILGLVLQGIVQGHEEGTVAKIQCLLDRAIYLDPRGDRVSNNLKDIEKRQIAIAPLGQGESGLDTKLVMVEPAEFKDMSASGGQVTTIESFVWELAILTSKGRVPEGTPLDQPAYLARWPNLTRLAHIPNAMKITAYWLRMSSTLPALAENLGVSIHDVFSLYTATSMTGLSGIAKRNEDKLIAPDKPVKHEKRNLFGAIMSNLRDKP